MEESVTPGESVPSSGRETYEFNDFDAHIDKKENSELRKPKSQDHQPKQMDQDPKDLEIKTLK